MTTATPQSQDGGRRAYSEKEPRTPDSRSAGALLISPGARKIVQAALEDDVSVSQLADLASADPAFALRVLSVANSAAYTRTRNVTNVQQACALLGIRGMRNIALGMMVADLVPAAEGAGTLLSSCLRRAVMAQGLAEKTKTVSKDDAFFAGLLLEVGLLHQACDHFEECVEVCRSPGRHRVTRERAAGLVPHPERGAELAQALALPASMQTAILEHHAVMKPQAPLSCVCWVAEACASVFETGDENQNLALAEFRAQQLGMLPDELAALLDEVPHQVSELAQALECAAGPNSERGIQRPAERDLAEMQVQYEQLIQVLAKVMDDRDRLQQELDEAHLTLARHGVLPTTKG